MSETGPSQNQPVSVSVRADGSGTRVCIYVCDSFCVCVCVVCVCVYMQHWVISSCLSREKSNHTLLKFATRAHVPAVSMDVRQERRENGECHIIFDLGM